MIFQTYITESKRLHSLKYHWVVKVKISGFQKWLNCFEEKSYIFSFLIPQYTKTDIVKLFIVLLYAKLHKMSYNTKNAVFSVLKTKKKNRNIYHLIETFLNFWIVYIYIFIMLLYNVEKSYPFSLICELLYKSKASILEVYKHRCVFL